jgi:hypothetical protein
MTFFWPNEWVALDLGKRFDSKQTPPTRVIRFVSLLTIHSEIVPY